MQGLFIISVVQLCFLCGCAVRIFGVMRCGRFFLLLSHVGSHLYGGLLPLLLSLWVFVCGGFSQD